MEKFFYIPHHQKLHRKKTLHDNNNRQIDPKNLINCLHHKLRSANKPNPKCSQIYSKNYGNIINLQKIILKANRSIDDPEGFQVFIYKETI